MEDMLFNEIKEKALPYFRGFGGHGFDHTERVVETARLIALAEKADLDIVLASALLHDIAREREGTGKIDCHAEQGAKDAERILKETSFPVEKIPAVSHAIAVHRFSKGLTPNSPEGKVLQDADRLDAIGAVAIARVFSHGGQVGRPFYERIGEYDKAHRTNAGGCLGHFSKKIFRITPESFHTKTARKIAKKRYAFTEDFVEEFVAEAKGKA